MSNIRSELMHFLDCNKSTDKILIKIYDIAKDITELDESFSAITALRKILEAKESYLRALEISKLERIASDAPGVFWVRMYDRTAQNLEDPVVQETDTYDGCPDCKGTGFIGDPANRCIECNGTGEADTK